VAGGGKEEPQRPIRETGPDRAGGNPAPKRPDEETSLLGFVNVVLKHRRMIVGFALLATLVCIASALLEPRSYSTRVLFTARGSQSGLLAGIAAQYGLSIVGSDPSQSIEFYEDFLKSHELLSEVAKKQYQTHNEKGVKLGTLPQLYGIHAGTRDAEVDLAVDVLRAHIGTDASRRTGVVTFSVGAPNPELAQQVAQNIVTQLGVYNSQIRKSQATAERNFIEARLTESKQALSGAEDQLKSFRDTNREYATSPSMSLENDRLQRQVTMRQQLYTALTQAYEQARIAEVHDIPVLSIVEPPELPSSADTSYGLRNTLLGAIAGILLGIVLAFVRERLYETKESGSRVFADFSDLRRATLGDLTRPWQPVGRFFRPHSGP
jgi:uncharacterized protein involved in exopolysaccharide biosynthesis